MAVNSVMGALAISTACCLGTRIQTGDHAEKFKSAAPVDELVVFRRSIMD